MLSILLQPVFDGITDKLHINRKNPFFVLFQLLRTFIVVLVGYVFDVAPSFFGGIQTIGLFFTGQDMERGISEINGLGLIPQDFVVLLIGMAIIFIASVIQERHPDTTIRVMLDQKPLALRFVLLYLGVIAVVIYGIYGSGYNAADFVYMQF